MITIVTEIAKYLIIFFMVLYTVKCFTVLKPVPADKKRRALNVQIFYVFMIHFLCYLTLYLHYEKKSILIFYLLQMIVSITYMVSYHAIYKGSSRLITNNMSFLLHPPYKLSPLSDKRFRYKKSCHNFLFFQNIQNFRSKSVFISTIKCKKNLLFLAFWIYIIRIIF